MIAGGITLLAFCLLAFIIYHIDTDDEHGEGFAFGFFWTIVMILGIVLVISGAQKDNPIEHKTSEFSLKTQVTKTIVDDRLISTDTIYIFTPKPKQ